MCAFEVSTEVVPIIASVSDWICVSASIRSRIVVSPDKGSSSTKLAVVDETKGEEVSFFKDAYARY